MNQNYELVSYKVYPEDQYTMAVAKVRIDKRFVLTFVQKKGKDGGLFWVAPSVSVTAEGQKSYISAHIMDSNCEGEAILEFLRSSVKKANAPAGQQVQMSGSIHGGVAENEAIPF